MPSRGRLAGAPISWGVCEVPGWGHQMLPERVLAEMREAGLAATELGPPGYLPEAPEALARLLAAHDLRLAAGFVAAVLHRADRRAAALAELEAAARRIAAAGGSVLVVAGAATGPGYDRRERLDAAGWAVLVEGLARARALATANGLALAFHPHVGTMIEGPEELAGLLERSDVDICLDTGHLFVGGADPARVAGEAGARVRHVHLKDVDAALAGRVRGGRLGYGEAVRLGLYRPLGSGDVDVAAVVRHLESAGYRGWYVLEQDVVLAAEPSGGEGPAADVRRGVAFFESLEALPTPGG